MSKVDIYVSGAALASRRFTISGIHLGRRVRALAAWVAMGAAFALVGGCGGGDGDQAAAAGSGGGSSSWTISGSPPVQILAGSAYSFTPTVANPNSATLTFTYSNLPSWATASSTSGAITGTPGAGAVGTYSNIRLTVSDGTNTYNSPLYSIQVVGTASGSVTLQWQPPTTKTDGSPLSNPSYRVYFGTAQGSYSNVRNVPAGLASFVVDQLTPGTYYFVLTAVEGGVESVYSNVASKVVN